MGVFFFLANKKIKKEKRDKKETKQGSRFQHDNYKKVLGFFCILGSRLSHCGKLVLLASVGW